MTVLRDDVALPDSPPQPPTLAIARGESAGPTGNTGRTLQRIRAEYLEMPALRLTLAQAQRLWNLDEWTCAALLDALVDERFLCRTDDHRYVRNPTFLSS